MHTHVYTPTHSHAFTRAHTRRQQLIRAIINTAYKFILFIHVFFLSRSGVWENTSPSTNVTQSVININTPVSINGSLTIEDRNTITNVVIVDPAQAPLRVSGMNVADTYARICLCVCLLVRMFACEYVCLCVCLLVSMFACVYVCLCMKLA